ncbi:proteoglycan 4-like isoform X2 [Portunus trituberculatus]|uniref:proteoglycan 4-like isoform X2 n=1 Tax=Portunus trituberculatus TaxID=210409 RepID=UPI001E1D01CE|nr:proteoglycan 4-like isoform X2 [Portunus trituberculatus]
MKDTEKEIEEENTDGEKESEDKEDIKDTDSYNTIQEMGNEDEGAKQPGSVQGVIPTNNRDKFPYLVSIIQFKLRKRRRKKPKEAASTKKKKVVRLCSGSIINHKFVLTTTSCCTYCWDIWNKKFKKKQPTTHSSHQEGKRGMSNTTNSSMQPTTSDSSLQPQNIERSLSSLSDLHQSTQIEQSRVRKKKVSTSKGRKDAKGKPPKRGPQKENIKKKKEKKKKKKRKRRRARPRLSDIKVAVGFSTLNKMELNTLPLDKVVSIWLPEECAEKMNKRKKNKLVFPVECPVLLELSESIEFGPFVSPLCLPIFRTFNPNFLIGGSITYWSASGDTKLTSLTPSLLPGIVRLSASVCQIKLGGKLPHTTMMCTLALPDSTTGQNQSMCFGDEGAPFLSYTLPHYGHTEYLSAYAILAISGCKKAPKIKDKPKPSKPTRPKPKPTKPKPGPSKPTKPKPGPSKPTKQKPGPSKPTKPKPGPSKPTKPKPGPSKPTKPKPGPSKPTKPKPGPSKPTKPKPGPSKPTKPKPGSSKPKPGPSNPTKPKPGPSKPTKPKPGPSKPGSSKPRQPTKPGPHKTKPKPSKTEPKLIKRMRKPQTIKKSEKKPKKVKKDKESQGKQKGSKKKKKRKKRKPKKYNKKKTTNSGIDVWVEIAPYINWIIKVVFQGDDDLVCQRSSIEPQ